MSDYIVSSLKYRPSSFESVIGQKQITKTLENSIKENKIPSAILFCGPRGVGKTSCARIFAREINNFDYSDDLSFNIFELDAASNNKVEDIRDLIDKVRIPPQSGKYKVYIIDEVHMLSKNAENAFLKTLEEPPPHIVFILATTEKNKILPTILSRCQIYDFNRISENEIAENLKQICVKEGVKFEDQALRIIAKKSDGSLRDSLTILDRVVNFTNKSISLKETSSILNILDNETYIEIVDKIINGLLAEVIEVFNELSNKGFDEKEFLIGLANHYRNLLIVKSSISERLITDKSSRVLLSKQSEKISKNDIIDIIIKIEYTIFKYSEIENKKLLVEILLMKISSKEGDGLQTEDSSTEKKKIDLKKIEKRTDLIQNENKRINAFVNDSVTSKSVTEKSDKLTSNNQNNINNNPIKIDDEVSAFSLSSLKIKKEATNDIRKIKDYKEKKEEHIETKNLIKKWNLYAKELEKKGKDNFSSLLTLNKPRVSEETNIIYNVPTKSSKKELFEIKDDLTSFLKLNLKNDFLELKFEINN